uniref:Uncharacterized protein n=1 Tax=Arundo donax TaxID=35708 RepID=A0A0A9BUK8_ARUDO
MRQCRGRSFGQKQHLIGAEEAWHCTTNFAECS